MPRYKIFLSHASQDRGVAGLLKRLIEGVGADCWLDAKDITAGAHWRREIEENLRSAQELLILASPRFAQSRWLDLEVGIAIGARVDIVPMLYDCVPARIADFDAIKHLQATHIEDFETYEGELSKRVTNFGQNRTPRHENEPRVVNGVPEMLPPPTTPGRFFGRAAVEPTKSHERSEGIRRLQERIKREFKSGDLGNEQ